MRRYILILSVSLLVCRVLPAQISGHVYDGDTKVSVPMASVTLLRNGSLTVTDEHGAFRLTGSRLPDTLVVRHVGYITELVALDTSNVQLVLYLERQKKEIEEVVINTGYQTIPKERATGSYTHIANELFNRSVSTDLISRLEGIANGLAYTLPSTRGAPSNHPDIRIRGLSTIDGETKPLIVVDNFPYEGDINNINPNDVESMTLLKDAAAASIWGARAGNGVIVITTKHGKASRNINANFNCSINFGQKPDLYYYRNFLPPSDAVELERTLFDMGRYVRNDWTAFTPAIEILFALDEELIDQETANAHLEALKQYDIRDEAMRYLYRKIVNQQYSLNLNGGVEEHRFYVSAGLDKNTGELIGNGYNRVTLSAKNDFKPSERFSVSTSLNYMFSALQNNGISILDLTPSGMNDIYVYARLVDDDSNALPIVRTNRLTYTDRAARMGLLDWHYRPVEELKNSDKAAGSHEIRMNSSVRYKLSRSLDIEARYQYQNINNTTRNHNTKDSYFTRHLVNQFTQADGSRPIPLGGILQRSSSMFVTHYGRLQADVNERWGNDHKIDALAGFEIRQERNTGTGGLQLYGYDDDVLTHATNIDFATSYPVRPRGSGKIPNGTYPGNQFVDRFVSYYGNFAYTFKDRYVFSGSVRWDASNIFGVDFNQKGVPLWSVGSAWHISKESFFSPSWVTSANLRATYGSNGNVARMLSSHPYIKFNQLNAVTGLPAGYLSTVGNPELSWEQVNTLNFGLDLNLFDGRITGSVEWFQKNSSNLIGEDFIDPTTGIIWNGYSYNLDNRRNYADMQSSGVDVELNALIIDRSFKWQITVLFNQIQNRVTNYKSQRNPQIINYLQSPNLIPVVKGVSKDQLYALPWYGLDGATGDPLVMANGELGTDYNSYFNSLKYNDLIKIGVSMPPCFGSLRNTFSWSSFSLGFNMVWKAGHTFRRGTVGYNSMLGTGRLTHVDYLDRWQNPGDELTTNVPSMPTTTDLRRDQAYMYSEALYDRGDHIRVQDISLSYQLPQRYAKIAGLNQMRLYVYARNLGVIWKYTDYDVDPDVRALYPRPLHLAFGLQIQL